MFPSYHPHVLRAPHVPRPVLESRYPTPTPKPDPHPEQVLSVCSVQYKAVLDAMRAKAAAFKYEGVDYFLHEQGCIPTTYCPLGLGLGLGSTTSCTSRGAYLPPTAH